MTGVTVRQVKRELERKGVLYAWSKDMRNTFEAIIVAWPEFAAIEDFPYPEMAPQCFFAPPIARIKVLAAGSIND